MEYEEAAQRILQRLRGEYKRDLVENEISSDSNSAPSLEEPVLDPNMTRLVHVAGAVVIDDNSNASGTLNQGSAKSRLYQICAVHHWKAPLFECSNEEGPDHQKLFTFKVILEISRDGTITIECMGNPHSKKKAAAENAAEGALWFLHKAGYTSKHS